MDVETLTGDRVVLRPWRADDAPWYVAARDDVVFALTTERRDLTDTEVVDAIEHARVSDTLAAFAIEDEQRNLAVEVSGAAAEISYFIAPNGRRRGLATDAVRTVLQWLRTRPVTEVHAVTANDNDASTALLTRIGFTAAGELDHPTLGLSQRWTLHLTESRD